MSKTSAKYILQIKSVFLRLHLIYTNIVGCIINHVKKMLVNTGDSCWTKHIILPVLSQACLLRNPEPTTLLDYCPNINLSQNTLFLV